MDYWTYTTNGRRMHGKTDSLDVQLDKRMDSKGPKKKFFFYLKNKCLVIRFFYAKSFFTLFSNLDLKIKILEDSNIQLPIHKFNKKRN